MCATLFWNILLFRWCSARDWDRNRILGEIPRVVVQKSALDKGPL